jgi:broad specificity phosphatase PhoE
VAEAEKHVLCYVARHGTTDLNQKNAFRGPIDAPLDKAGWRDAHQLAYYFEPIELSVIVHSDRKRTRSTAGLIAKSKDNIEVIENPGLRAWNVGDLGGQPKNKENEALVDWHVKHPDVPLPGGESLAAFKSRVRPLLAAAIDAAVKCGVPVLLVAHSSVIHEIGSMLSNDHEHTLVEPGGVAAIYIQNGKLDAEPVFKPRPKSSHAEIT